jgi:uncharacterized membrane protein YphA (DoxX/SURF4 family)
MGPKLRSLHVQAVGINQWWVPLVELSAGGAVVIGLVAPLAALGLLVIILIASATSGRERIKAYKPIDKETGSMIGSIWRKPYIWPR